MDSLTRSSRPGNGSVQVEPFAVLATEEFVDDLHRRLDSAERTIAIQLMTFDGDDAGHSVARRLIAAAERGVEVRLLVDCFALRFVSDLPVGRREVRAEFRATLDMFDALRAAGADLRFTNPNGPLNIFALARNHKKLYVIDDVAYLGGVNVSDHNFAWHDLMVRIGDDATRHAILADFDATFTGTTHRVGPGSADSGTGGAELVTNREIEEAFDQMVLGARDRVVVVSPYALDRGLVKVLEASPARSKTVVLAAHNNFHILRLITPYLARRLARAGVELASYRRFSHAKFVLVDDETLFVGSSNFGRHSFWCNQEIGLVIRDPDLVCRYEAVLLKGIDSYQPRARRPLVWAGAAVSGLIDAHLRLYARIVVPLVPRTPTVHSFANNRARRPAGRDV